MTDMQKFTTWAKSEGYEYEIYESERHNEITFCVVVYVDEFVHEIWEFSIAGAFLDKEVHDLYAEMFDYQSKFFLDFAF